MLTKKLLLLSSAFFVLVHILLFNINIAEWGDSYRILRASEYIRNFTYPTDEKRPPLYSLILALRPILADQIFWGRLIMLLVSMCAFFVFYKLCCLYIKDSRVKVLALLLFTFNPIFLYWSIRIYADVFFALIVLTSIYLYSIWKPSLTIKRSLTLGFLASLGVLTRFEGYILFLALGVGLLFSDRVELAKVFINLKKNLKSIISYILGYVVLGLPYLLARDPLTSKYLDEPTGRTYNFETLLIYVVSFIFTFGFTSAFYFYFKNRKAVLQFFKSNSAITAFIIFELILILLWPAAIPRLFVPIIPFLLIPLASSIAYFFETLKSIKFADCVVLASLLVVYVFFQYLLKLQFLISIKELFIIVVALQVLNILAIVKHRSRLFFATLLVSVLIWSVDVIWVHKDIYVSVKQASEYATNNLSGTVGYNDLSSVSDWYLNYAGSQTKSAKQANVKGVFFNYSKKADLSLANLKAKGFDYILMTNEHNTDTTLDIESRPYLKILKDFRYKISGKVFFTEVIQVTK